MWLRPIPVSLLDNINKLGHTRIGELYGFPQDHAAQLNIISFKSQHHSGLACNAPFL